MTYEELKEAIAIFSLSDRATLREIKSRYRELVKLHHPDKDSSKDTLLISRINAAYQTLLDYADNYRFSFSEDEFYLQNPEERLLRQFENDPLWGNK